MIKLDSVSNSMFIDIESAGISPDYGSLDTVSQKLWSKKADHIRSWNKRYTDKDDAVVYIERAGIYAEFARIVCISIGYFKAKKDGSLLFRTRSFAGENEKEILMKFSELLNSSFGQAGFRFLIGHNIREFDIPFICRRLLINSFTLPNFIDFRQKRAWQINNLIDTLDLWKFGDYKNFASLDLLCHIFSIPSPKSDIDGTQIHKLFWEKKDIDRISKYCENDVFATAVLFLKLYGIHPQKSVELIQT